MISLFSFKTKIRNNLIINGQRQFNYNLRNNEKFATVETGDLVIGKKTFDYFFSKFINGLHVQHLR